MIQGVFIFPGKENCNPRSNMRVPRTVIKIIHQVGMQ